MPTPARGPQTTPPDESLVHRKMTRPSAAAPHSVAPSRLAELSSVASSGVALFIARRAALGFLRRRIHAIARSRALRLDGRATRERAKQRRTLRFSPTTLPRPSRPKGAPLPLQPRSSPLHAHPLARSASRCPSALVVGCSVGAADTRTWASVGSHGTFPATSVGTCRLVRRRMFGLGCAN